MATSTPERVDEQPIQHISDEAAPAPTEAVRDESIDDEPEQHISDEAAPAPTEAVRDESIDDELGQHIYDEAELAAASALVDFPEDVAAAVEDDLWEEAHVIPIQHYPPLGSNVEPNASATSSRGRLIWIDSSPGSWAVHPVEVIRTPLSLGTLEEGRPNDNNPFNWTETTMTLAGELVSAFAAVLDNNVSSEAKYLWYFLLACIVVSFLSLCYGSLLWHKRPRADTSTRVTRAICYVATGFAVVTSAALQLANHLMLWASIAGCAVIAIFAIIAILYETA